jgi:hypothetical protein
MDIQLDRIIRIIRLRGLDIIVILTLFVLMHGAIRLWPDHRFWDFAIPTAFVAAFMWWRDR